MKKTKLFLSFILILTLLLSACSTTNAPPEYATSDSALETTPKTINNILQTAPDYVVEEAYRVSAVVQKQQSTNSFSFIAISDTHIGDSYAASIEHAGQAAALIRDCVDIDFATLLGDITYGDSTTTINDGIAEISAVNRYLEDAYEGIPNFRTTGNHDSLAYSFEQNNDFLNNAELFPLIGAYNTGADYGNEDGGYCYRDFEDKKTRIILLNTSDTDGVTVKENTDIACISGIQAQWFAQALDLSDKEDSAEWGILILSHIPLDYGNLLQSAGKILDAYVNGSSTSFIWQNQTVSYNYAGKNTADIIANIHGHNHCFLVDEMYICNQADTKYRSTIERICIPNACFGRNNERGNNGTLDSNQIEFGEEITYEKAVNSAKDTAFNIVTVDRDKGMIYCVNYGAGYDREICYYDVTSVPKGNYTNLVPTAQVVDANTPENILDGVGYRNGAYLSTGSNRCGSDSACVLIGAIRYDVPKTGLPPTIYIRGAELDDSSHVRFFVLDENKAKIAVYAKGSDISTYFSIEVLGEQYYKLSPISDGNSSVLSSSATSNIENGYIAWSLIGTGNNVVVTFDEPIE